jgi:hypothetical protein
MERRIADGQAGKQGFRHAKSPIERRKYVADDRDVRSEHPTIYSQENEATLGTNSVVWYHHRRENCRSTGLLREVAGAANARG